MRGLDAMESMRGAADTIFLNGRVYTVDRGFSTECAIAVKNGKIQWAGSDDQVKKYGGSGTKTIDLKGRTVLPGLVESHIHMLAYGTKLLSVDCFEKTKADILDDVKAAYKNARRGEWITGASWNENGWRDKRFPTKQELDDAAPDIPVYLTRICTHLAWANSAALTAAGIDGGTADPFGGEIHRTPSGDATGILVDTAAFLVQNFIPAMDGARREKAYMSAQGDLLKNGITSVHELALDSSYDYGAIEFIAGMYRKGAMKIAVNSYISVESASEAYSHGPFAGAFGGRFSMRGIKIFTDGSLGARSAWMLEDYEDRPGHRGNCRYDDDELYGLMMAARRGGFQISTHAIGDAANRQAVRAYDRVLREIPDPTDHRSRIEHAQIMKREDMKRLLDLKIIPSMQFAQCTSDREMTEERIGHGRLEGTYAWRSFIDGGAVICGGSDAPVELINPFYGMYAAVTRKDRLGFPDGGWRPEQKLTRVEAVKAFSIWGAYAAFEEHARGSIEAGKMADFTVIDRDIMSCPEDEIKDISVAATIINGETAYISEGVDF